MDSDADTLAGGFPHSDIPGSQLVCQLPEAYRRLPRPSSPVIAKASTVCACSLDHITPRRLSRDHMDWFNLPTQLTQTVPSHNLLGQAVTLVPRLAFIQIVKERCPAKGLPVKPGRSERAMPAHFCPLLQWWSQAGSNRRPPACKAGALPAELWPLILVGLGGFEPPTSPLSGVRSNHLSYRPG